MDPRLLGCSTMLELNTRLFHNCITGVSEEMAQQRPNEETNSIAFLAAHLVDARHFLARLTGRDLANPFAERLAGARGINDLREWPRLAESRAAWDEVSSALAARLAEMPGPALDVPASARFPVSDASVLGAIAFLVQHDSYHVGQLALLRKYFGQPAMKY